jgi:lipopolysaccharide heptosyltransferase II
MTDWNNCRNILCIRPDNMGDLLMSGPAIRALKMSLNARITVLTSSMAAGITAYMPEIDEVMIFDVPWAKTQGQADHKTVHQLVVELQKKQFDAAVIFTVFSQNPLPTAMLAYQAGIPRVLAYCRENPYGLLTNWVADQEPYTLIRHQVQRDIHLVATIGATINDDERLHINVPLHIWPSVQTKLEFLGWSSNDPWLILHPGVSEVKRQYPAEHWIAAGKLLIKKGYQLVITGTANEKSLTTKICHSIGPKSFDAAGLLSLDEFVCLVKQSALLLSVNTGPVHIAAAVDTPVVVLYAQTNPQHTPWQVTSVVLPFPVSTDMQSKNEVIKYLRQTVYNPPAEMPGPYDIVNAVESLFRLSVSSSLTSH